MRVALNFYAFQGGAPRETAQYTAAGPKEIERRIDRAAAERLGLSLHSELGATKRDDRLGPEGIKNFDSVKAAVAHHFEETVRAILRGEGKGERQSERGQDEAVPERLHRAARILMIFGARRCRRAIGSRGIVTPQGGCQRPWRTSAERSRPSEKGARERPFPRFRDFPVGLGRTMRGRYAR